MQFSSAKTNTRAMKHAYCPISLKKICCQLDENRLCSFLDREGSHKMLTFTLIARTHMPRIAEPRRKSMTVLQSRSTTATKTNFETRTNQKSRRRHRHTHIVRYKRRSMTVLRSRSTTTKKTNFTPRTNDNAKAQTKISQALFSPDGNQDQLANDISSFCNFHNT